MNSVSMIDGHIDNGMSDEDIIKALTYCRTVVKECDENCPYIDYIDCERKIFADALDLINRQKAEIERLKEFEYMYNSLLK